MSLSVSAVDLVNSRHNKKNLSLIDSNDIRNIELEIKNEKYKREIDRIDLEINKEIVYESMDSNNSIERLKEKYSYYGEISYYGLDFAIEFCNNNFKPITKLEKLYFDKLYLYASHTNKLEQLININDSELLGRLYNDSIDKKQLTINLKEYYINKIIVLIKNNEFDLAIDNIISFTELLRGKKVKSYKKTSK